jgi:hypothetical protein
MKVLVFALSLMLLNTGCWSDDHNNLNISGEVSKVPSGFKSDPFMLQRHNMTLLETKLKFEHSKYFGGMYADWDTETIVVLSKDLVETDLKLVELATKGPVPPVNVRLVKYSEIDLSRVRKMLEAILDLANVKYSSAIYPMENVVKVDVASVGEVTALLNRHNYPLSDAVEINEGLDRPAALGGGLTITSETTGNQCTTGFAARSVIIPKWKGVLTAGHCDYDYDNEFNSHLGAMTLEGSPVSYYEWAYAYFYSWDVQWRRPSPSADETNTFDGKIKTCSSGCKVSISGQINIDEMYMNDPVCKYGITTGKTCGRIIALNYKPSYVANATASFMLVKNGSGAPMAAGGDSGGPVYYWDDYQFPGFFAYGITSGITSGGNMIFMPIDRIEFIDVELITE